MATARGRIHAPLGATRRPMSVKLNQNVSARIIDPEGRPGSTAPAAARTSPVEAAAAATMVNAARSGFPADMASNSGMAGRRKAPRATAMTSISSTQTGVAAVAPLRLVRAVHPVPVALARAAPGQVSVPDEGVDLGQSDPLLAARRVDEAQLDGGGHLGEHGEVGARRAILRDTHMRAEPFLQFKVRPFVEPMNVVFRQEAHVVADLFVLA